MISLRRKLGWFNRKQQQLSFNKLVQKMLSLQCKKAKILQNDSATPNLHTFRGLNALKECIGRSEQDLLMLSALANENPHTNVPEFSPADIQSFGQRAAYQAVVTHDIIMITQLIETMLTIYLIIHKQFEAFSLTPLSCL
jgi:hypothetical protein